MYSTTLYIPCQVFYCTNLKNIDLLLRTFLLCALVRFCNSADVWVATPERLNPFAHSTLISVVLIPLASFNSWIGGMSPLASHFTSSSHISKALDSRVMLATYEPTGACSIDVDFTKSRSESNLNGLISAFTQKLRIDFVDSLISRGFHGAEKRTLYYHNNQIKLLLMPQYEVLLGALITKQG